MSSILSRTHTPLIILTTILYLLLAGCGGATSESGSSASTAIVSNDVIVIMEDTPTLVDVMANDVGASDTGGAVTDVSAPSHGSASIISGQIRYTPGTDYAGADSFTYTVTLPDTSTAEGTVSITVTPVNDAPAAQTDSASLTAGDSVLVNVLANDTDPESDTLTIAGVSGASHGTAVVESGQVRYTADSGYDGTDTFTYTVTDGALTANATVAVTISAGTPSNSAPTANPDTATLDEDGSIDITPMANDTDPENDALSIVSNTEPSHGAVVISGSTVTYTPDADYNGADSFDYSISDSEYTATATVSITVTAVNDSPIAQDDTAETGENTNILVNVVANDSDIDGDTLSISGFTQGASGAVAEESGSLRYTPGTDYAGTDSFTYTISDSNGGTDTATVIITVNEINDAPTANQDTAIIDEDGTILIDVLANDTDPESDTLSIASHDQGMNGTVAQDGSSLRYTPDTDYHGSDSFTYNISDGNGGTDTATVSVTINPVNDAPDVVNDSMTTNEDTAHSVDVLANDTDPEGDSLSITGKTNGAHGTVNIVPAGIEYTPAANYNGADSFTYDIGDGNGGIATGTVNVTVNPVNDSPSAADDTGEVVNEDGTTLIDVLANDTDVEGDTLSITGFTQGTSGTVTQEGDSLRYTPDANFNGADSFTYDISDGNGGTGTGTVTITVNSVNDAPVANNDSATLDEDGTWLVDVLVNDTDVEGDTLSITGFTQGTSGTVSQEGSSLRYTPDADYNGVDSFTYDITDGALADTATVSMTINAVNDLPSAADDTASVDEDGSILISVLSNDSDIDGDTVSITGFTQATDGTVTQEGNNLRYTPNADYHGSDSFTYDISDGVGGIATGTVSVTVNSVNDSPTAADDSESVDENGTVLIGVLANDTDPEGDTVSISGFTQGTNGTVTQEGDNLRYTPDAGYDGADSFTYDIGDGNGGTSTATVNVTVNNTVLLSMNLDEPSGDSGNIEITVEVSGSYSIESSFYLQSCDTVVYLYDSTGTNLITSNDDYVDLYGHIITTLDPGTYYVRVQDFDLIHLYAHLEVYLR